jgi:hypothetical protein
MQRFARFEVEVAGTIELKNETKSRKPVWRWFTKLLLPSIDRGRVCLTESERVRAGFELHGVIPSEGLVVEASRDHQVVGPRGHARKGSAAVGVGSNGGDGARLDSVKNLLAIRSVISAGEAKNLVGRRAGRNRNACLRDNVGYAVSQKGVGMGGERVRNAWLRRKP